MEKTKPLVLDFLHYILKPKVRVEEKPELKKILFNVVRLWSAIFLVSMFFALLSNFLLSKSGYSEEDFVLSEILKDFPYFTVFLLVVVWAPISEEIAFRLWLRFSPAKWGLGLGFFLLFTFSLIPQIPEDFFTFNSWNGFLNSIGLISLTFVFVFSILKIKKVGFLVQRFFERNFRFFFYTIALFFAIIHIENYDVDLKTIWYFAPMLIFPQIFLSFAISFIRMKYGFLWAIFTHAINNFVAITPLLLLAPLMDMQDFTMEALQDMSATNVFILLFVCFFFFLLLNVCIFSIGSLILDFTRRR